MTRLKVLLISLAGAAAIGAPILVMRDRGSRKSADGEVHHAGLEPQNARVVPIESPLASPAPDRSVLDASESAPSSSQARPASDFPVLSAKAESAVTALIKAHDFAAKFPAEGRLELSRSTAELAFIQQCLGHILAKKNRGLEAGDDAEASKTPVADDEVKFFHDGKLYIVRRGEFPIYDEARDRIASDTRPPRSSMYYEEYQQLFVEALSSLGIPEATR